MSIGLRYFMFTCYLGLTWALVYIGLLLLVFVVGFSVFLRI